MSCPYAETAAFRPRFDFRRSLRTLSPPKPPPGSGPPREGRAPKIHTPFISAFFGSGAELPRVAGWSEGKGGGNNRKESAP